MAVRLNKAALERVVRQRAGEATLRAARRVADAVEAQGIRVGAENDAPDEYPLPVQATSEPDGEARVTIDHPAGKAVQAKHGVLTRAAASLGMEVKQ